LGWWLGKLRTENADGTIQIIDLDGRRMERQAEAVRIKKGGESFS
jgi:hypothetical protein